MQTIDFIRDNMRDLHHTYDELLKDLSPEQLHWLANERGIHAAFIAWHYVRTEDNIIQFVLQQRPTVWLTGGWEQKFGLDRTQQGTGWPLERAQALRLPSAQAFCEYMGDVFQATGAFLKTIDDAYLQQTITVRPLGEMTAVTAIGNVCLTHGFTHAGEVQHLRGLQGLRGARV